MNYNIKKLSLATLVSLVIFSAQCMEEKALIASDTVSEKSLIPTFTLSKSIVLPHNYLDSYPASSDGSIIFNYDEGKLINLITNQETSLELFPKETVSRKFNSDSSSIHAIIKNQGVGLWDTKTGHRLVPLTDYTEHIYMTELSPDRSTILTVSLNDYNTIHLWNATTQKEITQITKLSELLGLKCIGYLSQVIFSPDGATILIEAQEGFKRFDDSALCLIDITTGKKAGAFKLFTSSRSAQFTTNETLFVVALAGKRAYLFNTMAKEPLLEIDDATCHVLSPDKKTLAAWNSANSTISLWNAITGESLNQLENIVSVRLLLCSPDSQTILVKSDAGPVLLWNTKTKQVQMLPQEYCITGRPLILFSPDSQTILFGLDDKTIRLWDIRAGQELQVLTRGDLIIKPPAFSADGNSISICSSFYGTTSDHSHDTFRVWSRTLTGNAATSNQTKSTELPDQETPTQAFNDERKLGNIAITSVSKHSSSSKGSIKKEIKPTSQESTTPALSENQSASTTRILGFTDGVDLEDDSQKECSIQ